MVVHATLKFTYKSNLLCTVLHSSSILLVVGKEIMIPCFQNCLHIQYTVLLFTYLYISNDSINEHSVLKQNNRHKKKIQKDG